MKNFRSIVFVFVRIIIICFMIRLKLYSPDKSIRTIYSYTPNSKQQQECQDIAERVALNLHLPSSAKNLSSRTMQT